MTIEERVEKFYNASYWGDTEKEEAIKDAYIQGAEDQKEIEEAKLLDVVQWLQGGAFDMDTLRQIDKWYNNKMSSGMLLELYKKQTNEEKET